MNESPEYTALAVRLEHTQSVCDSNEKRISDLEVDMKALHETQISLVKIANSVENMGKSMVELNTKVDCISDKQDKVAEKVSTLENQPAQVTKKRVDEIFEKISWVVVGGVVVWLLSHLLPDIPW